MSTPTTQTQLGADLSIKAVGEGIGEALKSADVRANVDASGVNKATESMRALARWQMERGILVNESKAGDKGYTYRIDPEAIAALTPDEHTKGAALYTDAVENTLPLIPALYTHGKSAYVQYFSETHKNVEHLMEPPIQRPTEGTMDNVATASLAFIDAMVRNPGQASDINGVTRLDIEALTDRMAMAGYLVPGENPGRDKDGSLSQQTPRGSYDDKLAIYEMATVLASNAGEPDKVQGIHAPVLALRGLQATIAEGEIEERAVFGGSKTVAPESDLQAEDMDHIMRTALLVAQISNRSQISTDIDDMNSEQPMVIVAQDYTTIDEDGKVVERTDLLAALREQMAINDDQGLYGRNDKGQLTGVLVRGNKAPEDFHIPNIAGNSTETLAAGKALYSLMRAADQIARYEHDTSERVGADDGAAFLGGPHAHKQAEGDEQEAPLGEFDRALDLDADNTDVEENEEGATTATNTRELELAAERFAQSKGVELEVQEAHMPEAFVDKGTKAIEEMSAMGLISKLSQLSGREERFGEHDAAILNGSTTTHFASLDDFSAGGDSASKPRSFDPDVLSFGMVDRKGGKTKEDLTKTGAVRVDNKNKLFHGYRNGSSSTAPRRVKEFIAQKLNSDDNSEKEAFRATLRRMVERPIMAETLQEAQAWRDQAKTFVERDNEEHRMRLTAMADKANERAGGLWSIDMPRDQAARMVHVLQAGGNMEQPVFVALLGETAKFYNDNAPVITVNMGAKAPEEVRNNKIERVLGGSIKPYQLETALMKADPKDTKLKVFLAGEVPQGATGEIAFQNKEAEKTKTAAKPRGIEADLPDVLG